MAKKLPATAAPARSSAPASKDTGTDDLAVLHPDLTDTIAGREITVREYGLIEGLRVRIYMRPFTADLDAMFGRGEEALVEDIIDLVAAHIELVQRAIAQSIADPGHEASEQDIAWIASLNDADGDRLINLWWGVCGLFFVRQVVRRVAERGRRIALGKAAQPTSDGQTSTSSSSAPASAPPSSSAGTPPASSTSSTSESSPGETANAPT